MKMTKKREYWNGVDYYLWCMFTMDEEQTRLYENPEAVTEALLDAGATVKITEQMVRAIRDADSPRNETCENAAIETIISILKTFATHQDLLKNETWEARYAKKLFR